MGDGRMIQHLAICCQGGGSHTAFTGGVLSRLYPVAKTLAQRVTLTGTSGGALCAAIAASADDPAAALRHLWNDVRACTLGDVWLNWMTTAAAPLLPLTTPYGNPLRPQVALRRLIQKHLRGTPKDCLIGACQVLSGKFVVFRDAEIGVPQVMASCSMPSLFEATNIDGVAYWDGVFSQNPPVADLFDLEDKPDEIWVIRIDPPTRAVLPSSASDIDDRSKELGYANALQHELQSIDRINRWLAADIPLPGYRPVIVRQIVLDLDLDNASKLDRRPALIDALYARGETLAQQFLQTLPRPIPHFSSHFL